MKVTIICDLAAFLFIYSQWQKGSQICYIKLKSRLSLCIWHANNSAVSASIKVGLIQTEICVFEEHNVNFYKSTEPTVHWQECGKDDGVSSH